MGVVVVLVVSAGSLTFATVKLFQEVRGRGVRVVTLFTVAIWILALFIPGLPILIGLVSIVGCCVIVLYIAGRALVRSRAFAVGIAAIPLVGSLFYVPAKMTDVGLLTSFEKPASVTAPPAEVAADLARVAQAVVLSQNHAAVLSYRIASNDLYADMSRDGRIESIKLDTDVVTRTAIPWLRWNLSRRIDQYLGSGTANSAAPNRLAEIAAPVIAAVRPYDTIFLADGALLNHPQQSMFGPKRIFRSVSLDAARIQQNLQAWVSQSAVGTGEVAVINALPQNVDELEQLGFSGEEWGKWSDFYRQFTRAVPESLAASATTSVTKAVALSALQTKKCVLFIVAHSDGFSIRLPTGESLEVKDLDAIEQAIRMNRPRVFLFSCETARVENAQSFAKALLDHGAEAVVAPVTRISAAEALAVFQELLSNTLGGNPMPISEAFQNALEHTGQKSMEVWVAWNLGSEQGRLNEMSDRLSADRC
jgi:hypothetical protein